MKKYWVMIISLLLMVLVSACAAGDENTTAVSLTASGTIAANDVKVSSELGGKVVEVAVSEGDIVSVGDILFRVDDEILQAQYNQALAAVEAAQATVEAAKAQLSSAEIQADVVLQDARLQEMENRNTAWANDPGDEVQLPVWYFQKDEQLTALQGEVESAEAKLKIQLANLRKELEDASNDDFIALEAELAAAQTALEVAADTIQRAEFSRDEALITVAQEAYDAALADLDAVQLEYDRMLSTAAAEDVLDARARVAIARARYDNALDRLILLQSGDDSLQVKAAQAGVEQARKAVVQADANLKQAEAAVKLLEIQLGKSSIRASVAGTILSLNVSEGELVGPGSTLLTIGKLEEVELTVYVPENQYGEIELGQDVAITADSFPGESFEGVVSHIADQAEFTPRNVQTAEGRKTTVYAIKILVPNPDQSLKPGMPVDVEF